MAFPVEVYHVLLVYLEASMGPAIIFHLAIPREWEHTPRFSVGHIIGDQYSRSKPSAH